MYTQNFVAITRESRGFKPLLKYQLNVESYFKIDRKTLNQTTFFSKTPLTFFPAFPPSR